MREGFVTNFLKFKNKFRRFLINIGVYTRKKSKMYLGLLIGVVIILILTIFLSLRYKQIHAKATDQQNKYNQIVTLSGEADILLSSNDEEALDKYGEVLNLAEDIKNSKYYDQAQKLIDKASAQIDTVSRLTRIDAQSQSEISQAEYLAMNDKTIFALSNSDLFSKNINSGNFNKVATLGVKAQYPVYIEDLDLIAAVNQNKIVTFDKSGNNLQTYDVGFPTGQNLKNFGANLYFSSPSNDQIYKTIFGDNSYSPKTDYLNDPADINNMVDFAIDGSIYTLSSGCEVKRFSHGNKIDEFEVQLPANQKISSCNAILTSESSLSLIVLAKTNSDYRLIETRKNGEFVKQYNLNSVLQIKNILADQSNSNVFVLTDSKVLQFKID